MELYLPIAETTIRVEIMMLLGLGIGFMSGLFGIGGGFLMTPLLILFGVPPPFAIGTQANHMVASSFAGLLSHIRRHSVDFKIGLVMSIGSLVGTMIGIVIFQMLQRTGQLNIVIIISYVLLLTTIGSSMLLESSVSWTRRKKRKKRHQHYFVHNLPFKMRFAESGLYASALLPLFIGGVGGILVTVLGIGGGFLLVPAMIYIIGMRPSVVPGTSLLQLTIASAIATVVHALATQSVDAVLAITLICGGVFGALLGASCTSVVSPVWARTSLALVVLSTAAWLIFDMIIPPEQLYTIIDIRVTPDARFTP
ncbi:MAG: sulfite exporter TauE/SafE family protein [Pseudomonadota bacterium]